MSQPLATFLPAHAIKVLAHVSDWREAISLAGEGLIAQSAVDPQYTREMIAVVEEHGPYIVVAPGIALAHARPSSLVKFNALSLVTLAKPVEFGAQKNDPVDIILGLAATDSRSHLDLMSILASSLSQSSFAHAVRGAQNFGQIQGILS